MSNFMSIDKGPLLGGTMAYPSVRGRYQVFGGSAVARQSHATDPIGNHALTLLSVPAGARVHIRDQNDTTTLSDEIATGTNGTFVTYTKTLQVYAGGSPLNNWRIKVRKASTAPFYRPYETLMTATVGESSIYVSMIQDD